MRVDAVREFLARHGLEGAYREFEVSSATVDLAAQAIGCEPGRIAKSLSISVNDAPMVLVVMGTARLDNRKFKDAFHAKARFIKPEDLEAQVGHPMGGVCPFALPEGVAVYLTKASGVMIPCIRLRARPTMLPSSPWRSWSGSRAACGWTCARVKKPDFFADAPVG